MARVIVKSKDPQRKRHARKFMRGGVRKCLESLGYDPKPGDLALGKVKSG